MCGIAACRDLRNEGRARPWARALMRHRGPDGEGCLVSDEPQAVLEHCRLAIIDPDNRGGRPAVRRPERPLGTRLQRRDLQLPRAAGRARAARRRASAPTPTRRWSCRLTSLTASARSRRFRGMFAFVIFDRETGESGRGPRPDRRQAAVLVARRRAVRRARARCAPCSPIPTSSARPRPRRRGRVPGLRPHAGRAHPGRGRPASFRRAMRCALRDGRCELFEYWDVRLPADAGPTAGAAQTSCATARRGGRGLAGQRCARSA